MISVLSSYQGVAAYESVFLKITQYLKISGNNRGGNI
jgi:hypothetical protein